MLEKNPVIFIILAFVVIMVGTTITMILPFKWVNSPGDRIAEDSEAYKAGLRKGALLRAIEEPRDGKTLILCYQDSLQDAMKEDADSRSSRSRTGPPRPAA